MPEANIGLLDALIQALQAWSAWEFVAVALALAYVLLAARENVFCWPAALGSTGIYFVLFLQSGLVFQTGLQLFYMVMAVYGWWHWRHPGRHLERLPITTWRPRTHLLVIGGTGLVSLGMGWMLDHNGDSAMPYLDAATTWFAVVTTFMVTRKKLENWIYWIVIDLASLYLFASQGLYLTAALMGLYSALAAYGAVHWWGHYRRQPVPAV